MAAYAFLGIFKYECVATEDGGHEDLELQVREVLTHTCPKIHAAHKVSLPSRALACYCFH